MSKRYLIRCLGYARQMPCEFVGLFLEWYRPNDPATQPLASWTSDLNKAMRFKSLEEAMAEWKRERTVDPPGAGRLYPDGRPNRPLTAFSIECVKEETVAAEKKGLN